MSGTLKATATSLPSMSWLGRYAAERPAGEPLEITALVLSIRSYRSGWCRAVVRPEGANARDEFVCVGEMTAQASGVYRFTGRYVRDEKWGEQLTVTHCELTRPATVEGIRAFLEAMPGLGPVRTAMLVSTHGANALTLLEGDEGPALAALTAISGVTADKARDILTAFRARQTDARMVADLRGYGLTPGQVARLVAVHGPRSLDVVRRAPYTLVGAVDGFGFLTVDGMARRAGLPENSSERLNAAILHALGEYAAQGHTYVECGALIKWIAKELRVSAADVGARVHAVAGVATTESGEPVARLELRGVRSLRPEPTVVALALDRLFAAESRVYAFTRRATDSGPVDASALSMPDLAALTDGQRAAVEGLASARLGVLTGGPGTGKTFTLKTLLACWAGRRVLLAAPTGKAAIRMTESTGREAVTVHRLLGWQSDGMWEYGPRNPLHADVVIIDESSMLDVELAAALTDAIDPSTTQLILVGDVDQLPSVGPGSVLRDIISSGRVAVHRLTEIKRQGVGSSVVINAARILRGEVPAVERRDDWMFEAVPDGSTAELVAARVVAAVTTLIPKHFGIPSSRIQVLTPQSTTACGVLALNSALRDKLNPGEGQRLRAGDRVIQSMNDYKLSVFNGEVGYVTSARPLVVDFGGGRVVEYDNSGQEALKLAYAITIHKSQGSEFDCVVIPLHSAHTYMLRRQLIYTAVTRAKLLCVLIGTKSAAAKAAKNNTEFARSTSLGALMVRQVQPMQGESHV